MYSLSDDQGCDRTHSDIVLNRTADREIKVSQSIPLSDVHRIVHEYCAYFTYCDPFDCIRNLTDPVRGVN